MSSLCPEDDRGSVILPLFEIMSVIFPFMGPNLVAMLVLALVIRMFLFFFLSNQDVFFFFF